MLDNAPLKSHKLLNKNPNARQGTPSCELVARVSPEDSKTIQAIVFDIGCSLELDGRSLLLRIPHVLNKGH